VLLTGLDIDACVTNPCHAFAMCTDLPAPSLSRTCACLPGASGNGTFCAGMSDVDFDDAYIPDINGCAPSFNPCSTNAMCTDNAFPGVGAVCECNSGFTGSGLTCIGIFLIAVIIS
jgi:hypothetical protein